MTKMTKKDAVVSLARRFAAHLDHLRRFHGVDYVSSRPLLATQHPLAAGSSHADQEVAASGTDDAGSRTDAPAEAGPNRALAAQGWTAQEKLDYLRERNIGNCVRCELWRTRRTIVFGVGNPHAELMFVGEAPGGDEDRQGEPFVGLAGKRLNLWLETLGLRRQDVYIANVLKCRPPGNRDPQPEEVDRCSPFLRAQIRAISPKVIVALGRFAGMLLSGREDLSLRSMRQMQLQYIETKTDTRIPLVVTYHPAYVLRREKVGASSGPSQLGPSQFGPMGRTSSTVAGPNVSSTSSPDDDLALEDLRRALALMQRGG